MAEITLNFNEGLNADADHMVCPPNQVIVMQEFYNDYGTMKRRFPSAAMKSTALQAGKRVDFITGWQDPAQVGTPTNYIVLAISNNKVFTAPWSSDGAITGQVTFLTFTDRTNAVSVGGFPATGDTLNGNLVIGTNNQPPVVLTTFNGNIAALGGGPPTGVCVKTVNNMMFIAGTFFTGTTSILSRVYWSAVSDPTTWPAASNLDFRLNDGDFVIALAGLGPNLMIFKTNSIGLLTTTSQTVSGTVTLGPLTTLWTGIGCCSPCAVDNLPDGRVVFLGSDFNLYITDGSTYECVSRRPYPKSSVYSGISGILPSSLGVTCFPIVKVNPTRHEIWIGPGASTNGASTQFYIYDYYSDTWAYSAAFDINSFGLAGPVRASPTAGYPYRMIYGDDGTIGQVYILEQTSDAGTGVSGAVTFSIPLVKELADFTPRSVVIPAKLTATSVTVNFGFDNVIDSSYSYTLQTSALRNVLAVKYPSQSNSIRPVSFQVRITNGGTKDNFYPITVSDQVLS